MQDGAKGGHDRNPCKAYAQINMIGFLLRTGIFLYTRYVG